ncbi:AlbA family DNA-binding domain-containing protein, partial [Methylacidimicrobium cyclopophantes]|uniref:AlbA family DNA-binding domain-containing protein n=1 Tax=Methylacidimicrobium cyclopophantes TaxID=1041766 RepID=UPI0015B75235
MTFRKPDNLVELLQNPPHENFNIEYKEGISLKENERKAKVVKTCLALRNADGGLLIIGFNNDATPVAYPWEESVQNVYHPDKLQELVSQYADPLFEITVEFPALQGQQYPVIYVPGGIRTPVVARKPMSGSDGKLLVRQKAVYVRTLVNGKVGTTEPQNHQDWDRLMEICLENREADFGRVLRRHLEPESLRSAYAEVKKILDEERASPPPAENLLDEGARRYEAAAS